MTRDEHYLVIAEEECCEITKAATNVLLILESRMPITRKRVFISHMARRYLLNMAEEVLSEFYQLQAVIKLLQEKNLLPVYDNVTDEKYLNRIERAFGHKSRKYAYAMTLHMCYTCNEMAHIMSKILRFGGNNNYPDSDISNSQGFMNNYYKLGKIIDALRKNSYIPTFPQEVIDEIQQEKLIRVEKYLTVSKDVGTLTE